MDLRPFQRLHDDDDTGAEDNGQGAAGLSFLAWVMVLFCGRDGDAVEETVLFGGLSRLFGDDEDTASPGGGVNVSVADARPWYRRIWGGEPVAANDDARPWFLRMWSGAHAIASDDVEAAVVKVQNEPWSEANNFIKWVMTEAFLFVPAKYLSEGKKWAPPALTKFQQVLPDFFLPSICLYAACLTGCFLFRSEKIKRVFQAVGLVMGVSATIEAFLFVGLGVSSFVAAAMVIFLIVLISAKVYERLH